MAFVTARISITPFAAPALQFQLSALAQGTPTVLLNTVSQQSTWAASGFHPYRGSGGLVLLRAGAVIRISRGTHILYTRGIPKQVLPCRRKNNAYLLL